MYALENEVYVVVKGISNVTCGFKLGNNLCGLEGTEFCLESTVSLKCGLESSLSGCAIRRYSRFPLFWEGVSRSFGDDCVRDLRGGCHRLRNPMSMTCSSDISLPSPLGSELKLRLRLERRDLRGLWNLESDLDGER